MTKGEHVRRLMIAALIVVAASSTAEAATYYVSPSGSDASGGSLGAPWQTLSKADSTASAGDTIYLRAGSYGASAVKLHLRGASLSWIGYPGEVARLLGKTYVEGDNSRFSQLVFDGPTGLTDSNGCNGESVLVDVSADGARIDHSEVKESLGHAGIYVHEAAGVAIDHDWIHDNGCFGDEETANLDHGVYFASGSGEISNNLIEHNYARGISLHYEPGEVTVANNTIVRNGASAILVDTSGSNIVLASNVIAHNGSNTSAAGIRFVGGTSVQAIDTLFYDNAGGNVFGSLTQSGSVTADPLFVSDPGVDWRNPAGAGDFHLAGGSPAIAMASTRYAPADDRDGSDRDATPDDGAYEFLPTRVATATEIANGAAEVVVSRPAGVVPGDVMVAQFTYRGSVGARAPSGWSLIRSDDYLSGTHQATYSKVAGEGEPSTYAFSSPSAQGKGVGIVAWRGIDTSRPVAASSGANEFTTSAIAPGVTAADDNTPLLSFAGALNGSVCWTPPTGMTERWTFATATTFNVSDEHADQLVRAGETGSRTTAIRCTGSTGWMAELVALNPAG
jgi:parallel beta-helix repeat protein